MGLASILFLIVLVIGAIALLPNTFANLTKSAAEKERDATKQRQREDEGFFGTLARILAGDKRFDNAKSARQVQIFKTKAKKRKQEQARAAGFASIDEFEKATDPNRTRANNITKFNPKGIIGFGITEFNQGRGIKDTQQNRLLILQFTQKRDSVASRRKRTGRRR